MRLEGVLKVWPLREKWWTPNLRKATKEVEYICSVCWVGKTLHDYQRSGSRMMRRGSSPMLVWWWLDGCSSTWRWKWWQSSSIVRCRAHWRRWIRPVEDRGKRSCKRVAWWSERCGWDQLCWTGRTERRERRSWGKMRWRQHCTTCSMTQRKINSHQAILFREFISMNKCTT